MSSAVKLHEFLDTYSDDLIDTCVRKIKSATSQDQHGQIGDHLREFVADVARALRRAESAHESAFRSEIPPAELARDRYRRGFRIEDLVPMYTSLSVALGEIGGRHNLTFKASEYGHFNLEIDVRVAEAVGSFSAAWDAAKDHAAGERMGFLAHELRNALASTSMAFHMLEQGHVGTNGRTADLVRRNLRRMDVLIDHALTAARAQSGLVRATLCKIPLTPVLQDIEASAVLERGIRLHLEVDGALEVIAEAHLLISAVGNLVQNAIKFSRDDASVVVRAGRDGEAITIEVEDECGGLRLPDRKAEELFEPFVRGGADRRGVGLGLAITRDIVRGLSGEIVMRDLPGKGCIFAVRLPVPAPAV